MVFSIRGPPLRHPLAPHIYYAYVCSLRKTDGIEGLKSVERMQKVVCSEHWERVGEREPGERVDSRMTL